MEYEYEGRTEREAIEKAASDLSLERDQFDVEILESQKGTIFKKGFVRIRVNTTATPAAAQDAEDGHDGTSGADAERKQVKDKADEHFGKERVLSDPMPQGETETAIVEFVKGVVTRMGYECEVTVLFREEGKVCFKINSPQCAVIIGRKGTTLDALQLLTNVYASRLGHGDIRIILDSENYRIHREEVLVRMAYNTADRVASTHRSILLEPMNPFERRIIHTTLSDVPNIQTKSEGDGVYKRVRILWRGVR